jgi:hypothetical protein
LTFLFPFFLVACPSVKAIVPIGERDKITVGKFSYETLAFWKPGGPKRQWVSLQPAAKAALSK